MLIFVIRGSIISVEMMFDVEERAYAMKRVSDGESYGHSY